MKKSRLIMCMLLISCGFLIILLFPKIIQAKVLFSDDFSSWPDYDFIKDVYNPPGGWSYLNGGPGDIHNKVKHYPAEVRRPGRKGDNDRCMRVWRHGRFLYGYDGILINYKKNIHSTRELYTRWYMRIPFDFELSEGDCHMNYLKMWRYRYGTRAGGMYGTEIYLNINGSSFSKGTMQVGKTGNPGAGWHSLIPVSLIRDGQWHCHELRLKLNTHGKADAEIQYWLDGKEKAHYKNLDYGASAGEYFSSTGLGIGNTGARHCKPKGEFQYDWRAIEFDDFVLSTAYVGPEKAQIIEAPTGLRIEK